MGNRQLLERRLKALSGRRRLEILSYLKRNRSATVSDIEVALQVSAPAISRHLDKLSEVGVVSFRRRGKYVFYRLSIPQHSLARQVLSEL